jgi:intein/homing endonuclease
VPVLAKAVCFVAGTPVLTKEGLKPIEEIKEGDKVLSYNEQTKQAEYKTVVRTIVRFAEAEKLLLVKVEGEFESLGLTNEHLFYVRIHRARDNTTSENDDGEWREAGKLQVGDLIRKADGTWAKVEIINQQSKGRRSTTSRFLTIT